MFELAKGGIVGSSCVRLSRRWGQRVSREQGLVFFSHSPSLNLGFTDAGFLKLVERFKDCSPIRVCKTISNLLNIHVGCTGPVRCRELVGS
jgi:hypothetical protein